MLLLLPPLAFAWFGLTVLHTCNLFKECGPNKGDTLFCLHNWLVIEAGVLCGTLVALPLSKALKYGAATAVEPAVINFLGSLIVLNRIKGSEQQKVALCLNLATGAC